MWLCSAEPGTPGRPRGRLRQQVDVLAHANMYAKLKRFPDGGSDPDHRTGTGRGPAAFALPQGAPWRKAKGTSGGPDSSRRRSRPASTSRLSSQSPSPANGFAAAAVCTTALGRPPELAPSSGASSGVGEVPIPFLPSPPRPGLEGTAGGLRSGESDPGDRRTREPHGRPLRATEFPCPGGSGGGARWPGAGPKPRARRQLQEVRP